MYMFASSLSARSVDASASAFSCNNNSNTLVRFGLCKIFVYFEADVQESTISAFPLPNCIAPPGAILFGLYTILLLPILYGVWHTNGRSWGASYIAQ